MGADSKTNALKRKVKNEGNIDENTDEDVDAQQNGRKRRTNDVPRLASEPIMQGDRRQSSSASAGSPEGSDNHMWCFWHRSCQSKNQEKNTVAAEKQFLRNCAAKRVVKDSALNTMRRHFGCHMKMQSTLSIATHVIGFLLTRNTQSIS